MKEALNKWLKKQGVELSTDTAHSLCDSLGLDGEKVDSCLGLCYQLEKGEINEADFTGGLCVLASKKPEEVAEILRNMKSSPSAVQPVERASDSEETNIGLFDWSTVKGKPAITGYVSHNTSPEKALEILKNGYIKPFAGSISFSLDQCFTVAYPSVSFIFPESVIREKYLGREPGYLIHYPKEEIRRIWEMEMEVEVKNRPVYISDCIEILPGRDTCWKYVYGYKYHYVDIRDRDYYPWKEFKR